MKVSLLGNKRVCAEIKGIKVISDQSVESNGLGEYVSPYDLFKASLGNCMGYYVMSFCSKNDIPLDGITLDINFIGDDLIDVVEVAIQVDENFPAKYSKAVVKAAQTCKVKKQLGHLPEIKIKVENNPE